jgi:predicted MFS family arabinose efflux permease
MDAGARRLSALPAALIGLAALASAMGVGRFAFTPLLPLMQHVSGITLAQGGSLAAANYLGYLIGASACVLLGPAPHRAARVGLVAIATLTAGMGLSDAFGAWLALRFLAGVASAFVLVGISAWVLPLLAAQGRASWSGWVYSGVGVGIFIAGLVGLATGLLRKPPAYAWLLLGACSAAVALTLWRPMAAGPAFGARRGGARGALRGDAWRPVLSYGAFGFGYIVPATFLPAAARQLVADPAVFGWTWPVFGLAAAASTAASSRWWRDAPPRKLWASAQLVMAVGVLAPAIRTSVSTLLFSAVCVGGTFMVVTMAGMQEARRVAGGSATRLMAAMTAAFALGQLVGPFTVSFLGSSAVGAMAVPHLVAAAVLLLGTLALGLAPPDASRALHHEREDRR